MPSGESEMSPARSGAWRARLRMLRGLSARLTGALPDQIRCIAGSETLRRATVPALALVPLFLAYTAIQWRDFAGPEGTILNFMALNAGPDRVFPLLILTLLAMAPAVLIAARWNDTAAEWVAAPPRQTIWLLIAGGVVLSLLSLWVLRAFANSGDEYDYVFQAMTFLRGRLWNPLLPHHDFFTFSHIYEKDGKWVTEYPPGWPLLLAVLHAAWLPFALAGIACGAVLLWLLARFCQQMEDKTTALAALVLVGLSPFFAFNAGSYFSHLPAALFGVAFCYAGARFIGRPTVSAGLAAGAALGMIGLIRPFDVLFFAIPFGAEGLLLGRAPHYRRLATIFLGGLPFLAALLLYNHAITGNALLSPVQWGDPKLHLGWPSSDEFGDITGGLLPIGMALIHYLGLAEWTSPLLAIAWLPALYWRARTRRLRFYDLVFPGNIIAYLFYPSLGVNEYGPRYYLDTFPLMAVTVASWFIALLADRRHPRAAGFAAGMGLGHVMISGASFIAFAWLLHGVINERMDLYDQVRRAHLDNAVVVIRAETGVHESMVPNDLVRNGLSLDGPVIYALNPMQRMPDLQAMFPHRVFFAYDRVPTQAHGTLTRLPGVTH
jgi:hypothetical protein